MRVVELSPLNVSRRMPKRNSFLWLFSGRRVTIDERRHAYGSDQSKRALQLLHFHWIEFRGKLFVDFCGWWKQKRTGRAGSWRIKIWVKECTTGTHPSSSSLFKAAPGNGCTSDLVDYQATMHKYFFPSINRSTIYEKALKMFWRTYIQHKW